MGSLRVVVVSGVGVVVLILELIEYEFVIGILMGLVSKYVGNLGYYIVGCWNVVFEW